MTFTALDALVLIIVLGSIVVSVLRGFFREIIGLVGWVAAFVLASVHGPSTAAAMPAALTVPELRVVGGYVTVFLLTLLVANIANLVIDAFLRETNLKPLDRILGAVFGVVRGGLILVGVAILAGFTQFPKMPVWTNSLSAPLLVSAVKMAKPLLPANLSNHIQY